MKQHNDNEGMQNIKTIDSLEKEIWDLKKEIDRLNEYVQNLEIIDKQHQEMNGKMHTELAKLKIANKFTILKLSFIKTPIIRRNNITK